MFDLHRLRLLHELALRGTLAAVAEALAYSPSTVSQQLAQLEKEAGVRLLQPDGRRVRLTAHGHALAAHAARALELDEHARAELASIKSQLAPIRIAAFQTAARNLVPRAITLLAERAPGLRVEFAELAPEVSLLELSARAFDVAIAEQYPGHTRQRQGGIVHSLIGMDPLQLVAPADAEVHHLADLKDLAWVFEPPGTAARQWTVQQCRAAGFEPDVRFSAADLGSQVSLIAAGHAAGMLPDLVWGADDAQLSSVQLLPLPGEPAREIFAAFRSASVGDVRITLVQQALEDSLAERAGLVTSSDEPEQVSTANAEAESALATDR